MQDVIEGSPLEQLREWCSGWLTSRQIVLQCTIECIGQLGLVVVGACGMEQEGYDELTDVDTVSVVQRVAQTRGITIFFCIWLFVQSRMVV